MFKVASYYVSDFGISIFWLDWGIVRVLLSNQVSSHWQVSPGNLVRHVTCSSTSLELCKVYQYLSNSQWKAASLCTEQLKQQRPFSSPKSGTVPLRKSSLVNTCCAQWGQQGYMKKAVICTL